MQSEYFTFIKSLTEQVESEVSIRLTRSQCKLARAMRAMFRVPVWCCICSTHERTALSVVLRELSSQRVEGPWLPLGGRGWPPNNATQLICEQ